MPETIIAELATLEHVIRREPEMGGPVNLLTIDLQHGVIDVASGEATGAVAGL
jgi:hypothetical protein